MRPRLVASDLDGTLLKADGTVDDRTRAAIAEAEAAGALVVFCTARPHRWMRPLAQETGHHGVAVANAHPDVIASADEVTASNDQAGVARVLERLFGLS